MGYCAITHLTVHTMLGSRVLTLRLRSGFSPPESVRLTLERPPSLLRSVKSDTDWENELILQLACGSFSEQSFKKQLLCRNELELHPQNLTARAGIQAPPTEGGIFVLNNAHLQRSKVSEDVSVQPQFCKR